MENMMTGGQAPSPAYDFRVYDQVWQRVAPGTDPFSPDPAAAGMTAVPQAVRPIPPVNPAPPVPAPVPRQEGGGEGNLPGAETNPCCMGTEARESLEVLEGCKLEPSITDVPAGTRMQFVRMGYFIKDEEPGRFNRIVTLKDSFAKTLNNK